MDAAFVSFLQLSAKGKLCRLKVCTETIIYKNTHSNITADDGQRCEECPGTVD